MYNAIGNYKSTYKTFAASTSINMLSIVAAEIVLKNDLYCLLLWTIYNITACRFPPFVTCRIHDARDNRCNIRPAHRRNIILHKYGYQ